MTVTTVVLFFVAVSFILFGKSCFHKQYMKDEFERYGLTKYRHFVGFLQLFGGFGLIAGFYFSPTLAFSAALGLTVLMVAGFGVRLKIKDGVIKSTPALVYALLSAYLAYEFAFLCCL